MAAGTRTYKAIPSGGLLDRGQEHHDAIGSVVGLIDSTGVPRDTLSYTAFGECPACLASLAAAVRAAVVAYILSFTRAPRCGLVVL